MEIWNIPLVALGAGLALNWYVALVATRVQSVVYNLVDHLAEKKGTGVSSASRGQARKALTPGWLNYVGYGSTLVGLVFFLYLGSRFGWVWAFAYMGLDYALKSVPPPLIPTVAQCFDLVEKTTRRTAPKLADHIEAHRSQYHHR